MLVAPHLPPRRRNKTHVDEKPNLREVGLSPDGNHQSRLSPGIMDSGGVGIHSQEVPAVGLKQRARPQGGRGQAYADKIHGVVL